MIQKISIFIKTKKVVPKLVSLNYFWQISEFVSPSEKFRVKNVDFVGNIWCQQWIRLISFQKICTMMYFAWTVQKLQHLMYFKS